MIRARFLFLLLAVAGCLLLWSPGCDELVTETVEVTIAGHPTAEFTYGPDSGCFGTGGFEVAFEDASSGPVTQWFWNFGDGDTVRLWLDSGDNGDISHTYTTEGSFTVVLTVFDNLDGSDPESKRRAVIIGNSIDSLTVSDTLVCPGTEVTFTAHEPAGGSSFRWLFGDETSLIDTSMATLQTHVYDNRGLYVCSLIVSGSCGFDTVMDTVHVIPCADVMFSADPPAACASSFIGFIDETPPITDTAGNIIGSVVWWQWSFGDGTNQAYDSLTDTVWKSYGDGGTYGVTLTLTTDSGGVTSYTDSIFIAPTTIAAFGAAPVTACQIPGRQYVVAFTDSSIGATSWVWDFGDGDSAFEKNAYHAYLTPGIYSVELTASGPCGTAATTLTDLIEYSDQLSDSVAFEISPNPADTAATVTFTDISPAATVKHYLWYFGDGDSSLDASPVTHEYDTAGTYPVSMTIYNSCDSRTASSTVSIVATPEP